MGPARSTVIVVFLFLVPGCLHASDPEQGSFDEAEPPVLIVVVTDDEFFPIQGAIVFLEGYPTNETTDENGTAVFPLRADATLVKAWSPSHYRASVVVEPANRTSMKTNLALEPRPPDLRIESSETMQGVCYLGVWMVTQRVGGCLPPPECWTPCSTPRQVVYMPIPESFQNATVRLSWESSQGFAFTVRIDPPRPFANGVSILILEGRSPIVFDVRTEALGTDVPLGNERLVFVSDVPGDAEQWNGLPVIYSEGFVMDADTVQLYRARQNDPW